MTLGKIGSSPTKVIVPPVFSGESPRSCITARKCALMSKPAETFGVSNVLLVMMIPFDVIALFSCFFDVVVCSSLAGKCFESASIRVCVGGVRLECR